MILLASTLLTGFVLAAVGSVAVRALARRYGLVVAPRVDRWHEKPTALYGGVAIAVAATAALVLNGGSGLLGHPVAAAVLAGALLLFLVGVVDDARGIGPVGKFILQVAAGAILIVTGVVYPLTPWAPINALVTLFWFVGITNALNLLDNMDGVTAGIAAIAALGFAAFFAAAGDVVLASLALATAGAAAGFLVLNFNPASLFMGDAGSLFLGGMLAGLGTAYPLVNGASGTAALIVPALILLVPILDTTLVTVTRTLHNRRISVGGRDHSTHRLVNMGFSEARAALFLYALGLMAFVVAWTARWLAPGVGMWLGLVFLTGALIFTGYLGRLHRYDDGQPHDVGGRGLILRNILLKRRGLVLLLDVVLFGVAYYGAWIIYYDGSIPAAMTPIVNATIAPVVALKLAAFHYFRVYRGVWDRAGLADVHRIVKATLLGSLVVVGSLFLVARGAGIPRAVFVMDVLLTGALAIAARSSFHSLDRFRRRLRAETSDTILIVGAGPEADLVLKSLSVSDRYDELRPVGFLDDREDKGTLIHGLPVLGSLRDLSNVLAEFRPHYVVLASGIPEGTDGLWLRDLCDRAGVELLTSSFKLERLSREHVLQSDQSRTGEIGRDERPAGSGDKPEPTSGAAPRMARQAD